MTYLNFIGTVVCGNPFRGSDEENGSILIGKHDFVDEVLEESWHGKVTVYVDGFEVCAGKVTGLLGSSYSEWTPLESDELSFGGFDIIDHLAKLEGNRVNVVVSDEPLPTMD